MFSRTRFREVVILRYIALPQRQIESEKLRKNSRPIQRV